MADVMADVLRLPGSVAEVDAAPKGPEVGAFFDLDGTLVAGYSARVLAEDRLRRREVGLAELARTIGLAVGAGLGRAGFEDLLELGAAGWRGRAHEDLEEMGERLFQKHIEDRIYPEMRELVRAHQSRGHTVVLSSSATSYQAEPVARFLGIDHVLCNRFVLKDGVVTGEVVRPVLWGPGKAVAVQRFAADRGVDLDASYFYADGNEDVALMYLVGHPRPTNPGRRLEAVAKRRGWPILKFRSRSSSGSGLLTAASFGAALPIGAAGGVLGLLRWNRRAALNLAVPAWLDTVFTLSQVQLNISGRENAWKERPAVFIFNHRNNFDPFITARIVERDFTGVAKKDLERNPLIGPFGKLADVAFIDRSDSAASVAALKPLEELARKGLSILVAPEGTRTDTTSVGPFKKGPFRMAMAAGIPLVPVVVRNAELIAGRNATSMNPGTVDVTVLPPIPVDDWTLDNLSEKIDGVRQLYIETLAHWPG